MGRGSKARTTRKITRFARLDITFDASMEPAAAVEATRPGFELALSTLWAKVLANEGAERRRYERSHATTGRYEAYIKFVEERVAPHKKLRGGVIFVEAIPKTASGKILRREVVKMDRGE